MCVCMCVCVDCTRRNCLPVYYSTQPHTLTMSWFVGGDFVMRFGTVCHPDAWGMKMKFDAYIDASKRLHCVFRLYSDISE